jgi:hypothetical protein
MFKKTSKRSAGSFDGRKDIFTSFPPHTELSYKDLASLLNEFFEPNYSDVSKEGKILGIFYLIKIVSKTF